MKIATWNVNSLRARIERVVEWIDEAGPDVLLMQEIKTVAETFPRDAFESRGYALHVVGQKSYNGVAIASRLPMTPGLSTLPGDTDDLQARYAEAVIGDGPSAVRVAAIYLPNGNPAPGEKFDYKLAWLARLDGHVRHLMAGEETFVLGGDYNVIPESRDVHDPAAWQNDALFRPESRAALRTLLHHGLTDAYRAVHPDTIAYSYWDYQGGAWQKDNGIRIDHLLQSPAAADRLDGADIDRAPRGREKASDHTPVWCTLSD
ncbi:MAG: exodeoxyribonuclease III [Alphaproteobacteria bacterium]